MIKPRFLPAAEIDLLAEVAYYSKARAGLGLRFQSAIEHAFARACTFPMSGRPSAKATRQMLVKGFPFNVVYRPREAEILIVAIAHQSRQPGYWLARVR